MVTHRGCGYGRVYSQNEIKPAAIPYPLLFALTLTIETNKCWITLNELLLDGLLSGLSSGVQVVMG